MQAVEPSEYTKDRRLTPTPTAGLKPNIWYTPRGLSKSNGFAHPAVREDDPHPTGYLL